MRALRGTAVNILLLVVVSTAFGAIAGSWLGREMFLRSAKMGLSEYASSLVHHADELADELHLVLQQANRSPLLFCSQDEISELRAQTFRSRGLKDIGRTRDGVLYCSAFLGKLAKPYLEGQPTAILDDGTRIYTDVALVLASANGGRATIVESGQVDAVLSPDAFERLGRVHTRYMIALTNRHTGQITEIAGSRLDVEQRWALAQGFKSDSRFLYLSQCSTSHPVCAVVVQDLADFWQQTKPGQYAYSAMGAVAGFGFGFAMALMYRQSKGLRHQLEQAIRQDSRSLRLVYEPILALGSRRLAGAEALLRWTDRDGISISPEVFIRIAEEYGLIGELTALVVRRAANELGPLLRKYSEMTLSINVAASDIRGHALLALLREQLRSSGIRPSQIILELTERSTSDLDQVRRAIQRLRGEGYKVHIDDFGTGFSSLAYLDQLAVDAIKVDRSFTRTIGTEAVTASILPQILALAKTLRVDVIVEGVETKAQLEYLMSTGAAIRAQGWYFSRPMQAAALQTFADQNEAAAKIAEAELVAQ
jgi:sensor c-di-GMP phosphodiesterase-like protein